MPSGGPTTVRDLLVAQLRALGATGAFVAAGADDLADLPGLPRFPVGEPALASILADAAGRLTVAGSRGAAGVAVLPGRRLRLTSAPGALADPVTVSDPSELPATLAAWSIGVVHTAVELVVDLDLDAPVDPGAAPLVLGRDGNQARALTLDPALADPGLVLLVGPGVVREGPDAVAAVRRFAARTQAGVLNTWGAKGLYRWDDPHHHGTVGLQARDFELGGLFDQRIVIAVGVDPVEAPDERWQSSRVIEVGADQLDLLAARWPDPTDGADGDAGVPPPPALYAELRAALAPLYAADGTPLTPARAASDLNDVRPDGSVVVADAGAVGLWIARTLPTTDLGSVVVPGTRGEGFAVAAAIVSSLEGRESIAVTTGRPDATTEALLELGPGLGAAIVLECWHPDAPPIDAAARRAQLFGALHARRSGDPVAVLDVPVDLTATSVLIDVAGEVIAWGGLP